MTPTARTGKKLLLVTGFFPPFSPMGAVRPPSLAAYWRKLGYDVRVIALENPSIKGTIPSPLPTDAIIHIPFSEPGWRLDRFLNGVRQSLRRMEGCAPGGHDNSRAGSKSTVVRSKSDHLRSLRQIYQQLLFFPDRYRSWINPAVRAGVELAATWRPDLIYSSCPPHSGHIVAQRIAKALSVPWIAELRDLWANNPYNDIHPAIDPFQRLVANTVLRQATACVALTQTAAAQTETGLKRPTIVSYNGYGAADFEGLEDVKAEDPDKLTIIHAGIIYPGRRDPTTLFQALAILGKKRDSIRVRFYHDSLESVARKAAQLGVAQCIEIRDPLPRSEILRLERSVDILLLCRWANPADDGIIPGKLFEYIGARRPILAIGSTTGEAVEIIRNHKFGFVSNSPIEIAHQLSRWVDEKREAGGRIADLPAEPTVDFVREKQFKTVTALVDKVLAPVCESEQSAQRPLERLP